MRSDNEFSAYGLPRIKFRIIHVWSKISIPKKDELFNVIDPRNDDFYDDLIFLESWLCGKKFDDLANDAYMETECPFFYLSSKASLYYSGGYALILLDDIERLATGISLSPSFGSLHFVSYMFSHKFFIDSCCFDVRHKSIFKEIIAVVSEARTFENFDISDIDHIKLLGHVSEWC